MEHLEMLAATFIREKEKIDFIADLIEFVDRLDTVLQFSKLIFS